MNSSQLLAVLVCALLALVYSAPATESLKYNDLAQNEDSSDDLEAFRQAVNDPRNYEAVEEVQPMDKRAQTFVRFGKRAQTFVRFGKRAQTFVRFG